MLVQQILDWRVPRLITMSPDATIAQTADLLAAEGIGAVIVVNNEAQIVGIISERDLVHGLAEHGADLLQRPVSEFMTTDVITCRPESRIDELAVDMTENRIRHLPVIGEGGKLLGVISIGDVVKHRVDELEGASAGSS